MSALQQVLLMLSSAATYVTNFVNSNIFPSSSFTTTSASYVDLLDATAGSPISVTITKGASSNLYVFGDVTGAVTSAGGLVTLGVNDGTTDYDLGRSSDVTYYRLTGGGIIITGLGAGSKTLKLRVKRSANTFSFNTATNSASITVSEVGTGGENTKATSLFHTGSGGTAMIISSTSYQDLLDQIGGTNVSVTITKSAGTDLIVKGWSEFLANGGNNTVTLGANDGTTDYDLGANFGFTTSESNVVGEKIIAGLAAGTYTFKLRAKVASATQVTWSNTSSSSSISVTEVAASSAKNNNTFFSSTYTINSTSFTDLLTGSGGSTIPITITKALAGTKLLVSGAVTFNTGSANNTLTLGVNDGTTDTAFASTGVLVSGNRSVIAEGQILLSGIGTGSKTLKLRVKVSSANTVSFSSGWNAYLTVREVP